MIFKKSKEYKKKVNAAKTEEVVEEILEKENENSDVHEISYTRATFWKRCSIILFDFITCALLCLGLFIGLREIVNSVPDINKGMNYLFEKQEDSSLFVYQDAQHRYLDIIEYHDLSEDLSSTNKYMIYKKSINEFFTFMDDEIGVEESNKIRAEYEKLKFDENMKKDGIPLFVKDEDGKAVENYDAGIKSSDINEIFIAEYVQTIAVNYFYTKVPHVLEIQKYMSNMLFFVEIPIALFLGFLIIYYIIPLCFFRGKQTLGRVLFKTGLVNSKVLGVSFGRFTARFAIMFFAEVILSIFTFGIPLFISFSLMAFSKKKQNFHDYMLGIEEVDVSNDKIFMSMDELVEKPHDYDLENFVPLKKE